jgi:succinate dehydrogenase/fumarate reductase flavoprotein subunit
MEVFDVIILGTGAAGLTAALAAHDAGARVGVFEKAATVGGTSAWSGGMVWIPNNHHMAEAGIPDSAESAVEYLLSMSHDMMDRDLVETFVETGPRMVRWLEANTPVKFQLNWGFPDYHPEHPGGKPGGGRSLECPIWSFKQLGDWAPRVGQGEFYPETITTIGETPLGRPVPQEIPAAELDRRRAEDERGCGQSLIGRLLRGCLDRGIEPVTGARARSLVIEDGRVAGVRFDGANGAFEVHARGGVVLATGGFEWNRELVRAFLRGPMSDAVSIKTNEGDGLKMAMRAGAALGNMREAWWLPVAEVPRDDKPPLVSLITCERTFPRSIMVNREGKRFTNEAANYNAFGAAFHEMDVSAFRYRNLPAWLIFDQEYLRRFGFGWSAAGTGQAPQWIIREPSLPALAKRLGIPAEALTATVERWNGQVAEGRDPDFHRGESANDTWWGDPKHKGDPSATLGPLDEGPFYAVEIKSGTLGTKGGPRVDPDAQVIDLDGVPIPGLYAAGNVMASPMGMTYGGGGGTLAPGMVFGFRAGRHAAARAVGSATG